MKWRKGGGMKKRFDRAKGHERKIGRKLKRKLAKSSLRKRRVEIVGLRKRRMEISGLRKRRMEISGLRKRINVLKI